MKYFTSPPFWLCFGFFGFPFVCLAALFMGMMALRPLGLMPESGIPDFGWGGAPGLFLGLPLGIVSCLSAVGWQNGRFTPARWVAFVGGALIGGGWLSLVKSIGLVGWVGEFGFIVPPLLWSIYLIIFAVLVRPPMN